MRTNAMKLIICILLTVILGGCATIHSDTFRREQFEKFSQKYSQFDLRLAWDNKISDSGVIVEGLVWNVRWFHAEGLEIWVSLVGPDGTILARDVDLIRPDPLKIGEMADFRIKLPSKPVPGSKLLFTYRFGAVEDIEGSIIWMQSFETRL
jgi:hypothetical protein